jgi:hypothetical protein
MARGKTGKSSIRKRLLQEFLQRNMMVQILGDDEDGTRERDPGYILKAQPTGLAYGLMWGRKEREVFRGALSGFCTPHCTGTISTWVFPQEQELCKARTMSVHLSNLYRARLVNVC